MNTDRYTHTRRTFLKAAGVGTATAAFAPLFLFAAKRQEQRPNILLITADDMNADSPGCFGGGVCQTRKSAFGDPGKIPEITPNIDRLASEGIRFSHAHITIAVCQPCRSVLMTGRYPHRNGAEGFEPIDVNVPTLQEILNQASYLNGILGKVPHLAPAHKFPWDMVKRSGELGHGRNPGLYYKCAKDFFQLAAVKGKPFFLMANSHDPHRPFHGSPQERARFAKALKDIPPPSRVYKPDEIKVPGFLPDLPEIRTEIAQYYSSVRRCDDTVGDILRALRESGQAQNTLTMFLSDNGMALPFAKTNCYLHSTRTPWIATWPGRIKPNTIDKRHFISSIDLMPTMLDVAGLTPPEGMDGFSFLPVLRGRQQAGRDKVFTQFHQTAARARYPMRCIQNHRFGYIFNPWSDGKRVFKNESQSGLTFKAMRAAAEDNPAIAARVGLFQYRAVEELYYFENDPDALHNLIDDPKHAKPLDKMRNELLAWMRQTKDPALHAFVSRTSPAALQEFMAEQDARAARRHEERKSRKNPRR